MYNELWSVTAVASSVLIACAGQLIVRRRKRKLWVKRLYQRRKSRGCYPLLIQELRLEDQAFRGFLRMDIETFDCLLQRLVPQSTSEWERIAAEFWSRWNFPMCFGALDGNHIVTQRPWNSGSMFFTYKRTYTVQLMALVDADYNFTYVDVGCQGRIGDAGVYHHSRLSKALISNSLNILPPGMLPQSDVKSPFMLVANEAFPLTPFMKPFVRQLNSVHFPQAEL